jgi:transcriptional regulator with XRE-family HTH domain
MPPHRRAKSRSPDHDALGRAVEEIRREHNLTQEELADRMNSEFPPIGRLERGVSNPTFSSLLRLADGLGVTLGELVGRFEQIRRASTRR